MLGMSSPEGLSRLSSCAGVPTWAGLLRLIGQKLTADALSILENVARSQDRVRQRRWLSALDERMMKDIGLSRADVWRETRKPWWRD